MRCHSPPSPLGGGAVKSSHWTIFALPALSPFTPLTPLTPLTPPLPPAAAPPCHPGGNHLPQHLSAARGSGAHLRLYHGRARKVKEGGRGRRGGGTGSTHKAMGAGGLGGATANNVVVHRDSHVLFPCATTLWLFFHRLTLLIFPVIFHEWGEGHRGRGEVQPPPMSLRQQRSPLFHT